MYKRQVQDFLILVPVLYVLGLFLKGTPKVPNWLIPWIIGVLGVALGFGIGGFNAVSYTHLDVYKRQR